MTKDQLATRLRENKGRALWPDFKRLLQVVVDRQISDEDRLELLETDELKRLFYERLRASAGVSRKVNAPEALPELWNAVARIADASSDVECVLLHKHDEYTGAVRILAGPVLAHPRRVWGVVGLDLRLTTDRALDGFCLGFNHLHPVDEYELSLWGRFAIT